MAITGKGAYGTLLKIGNGATSESFTTIDGVRDLTGPEYNLETIDGTHHSSASNYRETIVSFLSGGAVNFELIWDSSDTQHLQLFTDFEARTLRNFTITFTDAGADVHSFAAYITSMNINAPLADALTMSCTLTISGAVTRA